MRGIGHSLTGSCGARLAADSSRPIESSSILTIVVRAGVGIVASSLLFGLPAQRSVHKPDQAPRPVWAQVALARDSFGASLSIRVLSDARVLVNDRDRRRVLLLSPSLGRSITVMDNMGQTRRRYGNAAGGLIRYRGDTTYFVDPDAMAFVAILPDGAIGRTTAIPSDPSLLHALLGTQPTAAFDPAGRLLYRDTPDAEFVMGTVAWRPPIATAVATRATACILRLDPAAHRIDTLGTLSIQARSSPRPWGDSAGHHLMLGVSNPILVSDDYALLEDGTVALIRAQDYHVDWIAPGGHRESSPTIPHEWHRLTDSAKAAIVDSVKRYNADHPRHITGIDQHGRFAVDAVDYVVDPEQLADYPAPFLPGARADAEGNVWVRQPSDSATGAVYDIVDRKGILADRVELPGGTTLIGFGSGLVFVSAREAWGTSLAAYRIK